ncbi:MAG: 50S ribosomal protein L24 [Alphaproteobacteria bacterium]
MPKLKIRKDDEVIVVSGRDRGKRGKVLRALPAENRVVVEGVNIVKRHTKPSYTEPQGGIKEKEAPIHVSNVALIDPKTNGATRVGFKVLANGRKVRFAKRSGEVLDA